MIILQMDNTSYLSILIGILFYIKYFIHNFSLKKFKIFLKLIDKITYELNNEKLIIN